LTDTGADGKLTECRGVARGEVRLAGIPTLAGKRCQLRERAFGPSENCGDENDENYTKNASVCSVRGNNIAGGRAGAGPGAGADASSSPCGAFALGASTP